MITPVVNDRKLPRTLTCTTVNVVITTVYGSYLSQIIGAVLQPCSAVWYTANYCIRLHRNQCRETVVKEPIRTYTLALTTEILHIQHTNVVVRSSQRRMIWRKSFLLDFECFFIIRKCFRVLTHAVIQHSSVIVRSSQIRMIWRKSFLLDFEFLLVIRDRLFKFTLTTTYASRLIGIKCFLILVGSDICSSSALYSSSALSDWPILSIQVSLINMKHQIFYNELYENSLKRVNI